MHICIYSYIEFAMSNKSLGNMPKLTFWADRNTQLCRHLPARVVSYFRSYCYYFYFNTVCIYLPYIFVFICQFYINNFVVVLFYFNYCQFIIFLFMSRIYHGFLLQFRYFLLIMLSPRLVSYSLD